MWDVLSRDYDLSLHGDDCAKNVIRKLKPGSIIVFHDSIKAESRIRVALPRVLEYLSAAGFRMEKINFSETRN